MILLACKTNMLTQFHKNVTKLLIFFLFHCFSILATANPIEKVGEKM